MDDEGGVKILVEGVTGNYRVFAWGEVHEGRRVQSRHRSIFKGYAGVPISDETRGVSAIEFSTPSGQF